VRDKYRAEMEKNRLLVESTSRDLQQMNERNRQLDIKISQLEKENRAIEEASKRFLGERDKQMTDIPMQHDNYRLELHAGYPGS
jgi:ribonuclease HII